MKTRSPPLELWIQTETFSRSANEKCVVWRDLRSEEGIPKKAFRKRHCWQASGSSSSLLFLLTPHYKPPFFGSLSASAARAAIETATDRIALGRHAGPVITRCTESDVAGPAHDHTRRPLRPGSLLAALLSYRRNT